MLATHPIRPIITRCNFPTRGTYLSLSISLSLDRVPRKILLLDLDENMLLPLTQFFYTRALSVTLHRGRFLVVRRDSISHFPAPAGCSSLLSCFFLTAIRPRPRISTAAPVPAPFLIESASFCFVQESSRDTKARFPPPPARNGERSNNTVW